MSGHKCRHLCLEWPSYTDVTCRYEDGYKACVNCRRKAKTEALRCECCGERLRAYSRFQLARRRRLDGVARH